MGGRRILGRPLRTELDLVERIRAGLSPQTIGRLAERLKMSEAELCRALGIPRRTMARRKREPKLARAESQAVVRVARVVARATEVFGAMDSAQAWLRRPNRALGGSSPLSLLDTEPGMEMVVDTLGRIEHGLPS